MPSKEPEDSIGIDCDFPHSAGSEQTKPISGPHVPAELVDLMKQRTEKVNKVSS